MKKLNMNVIIKQERLATIRGEVQPLLEKHWHEIALHQDKIKLEPDWNRYSYMEANNSFIVVTARRNNRLIGYSAFFLMRHPHYKSCITGSNDVLFLLPEERKGSVGIRLIRESEKVLKSRRVTRVLWHVKPLHDFSPILKRLGYCHEETIMGKLL